LYEYGQLAKQQLVIEERLRVVRELPAETVDGSRVILSANIENPDEISEVRESGAEGIGLLRTEYLFLERHTLPTEEEQFAAYDCVARALRPHPVIIRTLDIGGDKASTHWPTESERNPFMGWRAIRICLQERAMFRAQLRAVLRASASGNVKIMYPMISSLTELEQANAALEECRVELRAEGVPFDEELDVGAMIEIPAAAMVARSMAQRVDFFSIGTNDLIQYSLAVDRSNPKVAHLYEPTHPGVLQLIKMTIDAGLAEGIWTGVCGEMAGDPALVPLLLGLGAAELSTAPSRLPAVKFLIRRVKLEAARALAQGALECPSGPEILRRSREFARKAAPELWERAETARVASQV
jgi:phosphotransferase system enzyme I (PtsI)